MHGGRVLPRPRRRLWFGRRWWRQLDERDRDTDHPDADDHYTELHEASAGLRAREARPSGLHDQDRQSLLPARTGRPSGAPLGLLAGTLSVALLAQIVAITALPDFTTQLLYAALLAVIVALESPGLRAMVDRLRASRADG